MTDYFPTFIVHRRQAVCKNDPSPSICRKTALSQLLATMEDDSPWGDDANVLRDSEWSKISSDFLNVGYREGITAGKEGALQEGFDEGYAETGAPIGRQLGNLRGMASALFALLSNPAFLPENGNRDELLTEARTISSDLAEIRFSDIMPPDLQAIQHAREHLESADEDDRDFDVEMSEETKQKHDLEGLEDMMTRMGATITVSAEVKTRPTRTDVEKLAVRLTSLLDSLNLPLPTT
ncbi:hypothetical protein QCA50_013824 [Cerrena zonata]|uniref:Protein YAE1 n=1 Tax=Cerrena zonata TaxID=2478898 RepID=A0AAW0FQV2_9APHY